MSPEPHYLPGPYPGLNNCDYYNLVRVYVLVAQARIALMQGQLQAAEVGSEAWVSRPACSPLMLCPTDIVTPEFLFSCTNYRMYG